MTRIVSSICPDNPNEAIKAVLEVIVEHAWGEFVGVLEAMPEHNLPAYVLFNDPRHRSTPALRFNLFSNYQIRKRALDNCPVRFRQLVKTRALQHWLSLLF